MSSSSYTTVSQLYVCILPFELDFGWIRSTHLFVKFSQTLKVNYPMRWDGKEEELDRQTYRTSGFSKHYFNSHKISFMEKAQPSQTQISLAFFCKLELLWYFWIQYVYSNSTFTTSDDAILCVERWALELLLWTLPLLDGKVKCLWFLILCDT